MSEDVTDLFETGSSEADVEEPFGDGMEFEAESTPSGEADTPTETAPTEESAETAETAAASNRLSTGIEELDRALDGGVPPGRLVALVTSPGVQSELLLNRVLAQRDTLYVSTDRPAWEVTKDIEPGLGVGDVIVRDSSPEALLDSPASILEEMGVESNLVVDSINELELVSRERYREFISTVKRELFETGSMGILYGVTVDHQSARDLTLRRADLVWRLQTTTTDTELENRLFVPKFRGGAALTDAVKLELTDEVAVDTSRDIA